MLSREDGKSCPEARFHIDIQKLLYKNCQSKSRNEHSQYQSDPALCSCTFETVLFFSCSFWQISGWAAAETDGQWQPIWHLCHQTGNWERTFWGQPSTGPLHKVINWNTQLVSEQIIHLQGFTDGGLLLWGWLSGSCLVWVEERPSSGKRNPSKEVILYIDNFQRCDCGNYFQLIDYDPLDPSIKAKFGGGFGSGLTSVYY